MSTPILQGRNYYDECECGRLKILKSRVCCACWHRTDECLGNLQTGRGWQNYVDEIAVERLVAGEPPAVTTRAERQEAVKYLTEHHVSIRLIATRLRISKRTVERLRARCST